jgi:hypothetical protein
MSDCISHHQSAEADEDIATIDKLAARASAKLSAKGYK